MMAYCRSRLRIACALTALASGVGYADFDAGLDAVRRRDYPAALVEFQILADNDDPDAQVNLGNLYMKGWGVKQDYAAAYDWYLKAAGQNSRIAQGKLGVLHYYGLGTVKDSAEAAKWFEKAADQGDPGAQSALGVLHAQGDGVSRNLVQAFFWLTLAFEFGDNGAGGLRNELSEDMNPGELADALAKVEQWKQEKGIADPGAAPAEDAGEVLAKVPGEQAAEAKKKPRGRTNTVRR